MKNVNLLAVALMLLGLVFANNSNANFHSPVENENTLSAQIYFDGGIVDPDVEDKKDKKNGIVDPDDGDGDDKKEKNG